MNKIAILGSNGHIGKCLVEFLSTNTSYALFPFSRSIPNSYETLLKMDYDVIINCIGIGDPAMVEKAGVQVMFLTEEFDNKVLKYLETHPKTMYINLSSGVVHNSIDMYNIIKQNYYQLAKMNAEVKHRGFSDLNIVDLRPFAFFSRFTNIHAKFFMSNLIRCIKENDVFTTDKSTMVRDYVSPYDFVSLVEKCIAQKTLNDAFDVYSLAPVEKQEILDYFCENYDLKLKIVDSTSFYSSQLRPPGTANKNVFYSENKKATEKLGYSPTHTAMQTVIEESKCLLS